MNYNFNNEVPIYLQIVDAVTIEIINDRLKPGQKIPSVREYALMFKVNPNTISKALLLLEDKKLIYTERTNGKYVTNDMSIIKSYKEQVFSEKVNDFLNEMKQMGYTKKEIINKIMENKE